MSKKATKAAPKAKAKAPAKPAKPASRKIRVSSTETASMSPEAAEKLRVARTTA